MKRTRAISLLLSLSLVFAMLVPVTTAYADNGSSDSGMVISKTATANTDGSYTITLEAYATGEKVISEVKEDVPTDIVLVLDQSGSMTADIGTVSFKQYKDEEYFWGTTYHTRNQDYYECRHNGGSANLWHKLGDDSFVSVSVTKKEQMEYTELGNLKNYETSWGSLTENCYYYYANNLYEMIGDVYSKVDLDRSGNWLGGYVYTYTFSSDGTTVTSNGNAAQPNLGSHAPLYTGVVETVYTYTYTDANGVTQTIGTSTGAETVFSPTLYERVTSTSGGGSRLAAIQAAVTNFANAVTTKAKGADGTLGTADDVNHRIAVVGFASSGNEYNSSKYENTEVFVGAEQYKYGTSAQSQYGNALQSMNTVAGQNNITNSIGALDAYGGTFTNLGMEMANGIFRENPIPDGQNRNRVIIVFTDGYPGTGDTVSNTVANSAVSQGYTAKRSTANGGYGATVYTVGIFSGADGTPVESLNGVSNPNKFMHLLSSNYKSAQSYSDSSQYGTATYPAGGGSYYLSAADVGTLNNIFQQISDQIETGGSSTTLSSETVIKDIIAPAFTLPANATASDITLETYQCTGKNGNAYTWSKNADAMGATAAINGDQVSVTGFDFAANYVGTVTENGNVSYRGHKLVISFKVQPKAGFLGGNNVYTNTNAGVYENSDAEQPVLTFPQPQVNVPIHDVTVTAQEKNVYLLSGLTAAQLKEGAEVKCGDVTLNLAADATNYGLEDWQTEYVNITVTVKDKDGNVVTDSLSSLTEDTTYTISVTVAPKTDGTGASGTANSMDGKTGSDDANINVFKPVLTFKDSEVYYGDTVPAEYSNLTSTVWKHGETLDTAVTMVGTAPTLSLTYTPDSTKIAGGRINTKQDIAVDVTVKIEETDVTAHTAFLHTDCTGKTCTVPDGKEFLLHVKTCTLTVTKNGGSTGEPYVFTVYRDGVKYSEVTIVGNGSETICELPVGTYTIEEDTGWSWRFTPGYSDAVVLSSDNTSGTISCTNTSNDKIYWLNGFSQVVQNIFGVKH